MKRITNLKIVAAIAIGFTLLTVTAPVFAQTTVSVATDTLQEVEIIRADRLTIRTISDTVKLTILGGNVQLKQGSSLFSCDSCVMNNNTRIFEAWHKIHINDSDTTDIYSEHLLYLAKQKMAYLDGGVKMTDGKATLTTPDLEYDMERHIGIYRNGGKVTNRKTTLTSQEGWYYADMKDVYFKKNVHLKDPAYTIDTDSLLYNSGTQTTRFISDTRIVDSSGREIRTREGFYNQQTGKAEFGQRPTIKDGNTDITANRINIDDSSGISVAEGNAIIVDRKNQTTIIAGVIFRNKNTEAILATRKPLMIIVQEKDSIYVSADTLYSAKLTDLYRRQLAEATDSIVNDTTVLSVSKSSPATPDSLVSKVAVNEPAAIDSAAVARDSMDIRPDTVAVSRSVVTGLMPRPNRLVSNLPPAQLNKGTNQRDSTIVRTTRGARMIAINEKDSTNRYFEAYRNVRIFNDSLQAVCDSMFYSFQDSVFRLYDDPVVWAQESQITGDTINLFTRNKKADKVQAYENGFLVNRLNDQAFNQIKATRMDGYFIDGNIDSVRARGFAQCIYYIQDEDSAYTGINETKSDVLDVYFRNKELFKVVFRSSVSGTIWPIRQKSPEEMRLPQFRWLEERRPKSRFEMYE